MENCPSEKKLTINLAWKKGASNWLSVLPLKNYNFSLNKSEFKDGLHLRYGWEPLNTPYTCPCGQPFTLTHAPHCLKGRYTHLRQWNSRYPCDTPGRSMPWCWNRAETSIVGRRKLSQQNNHYWRWGSTWHQGKWTLGRPIQSNLFRCKNFQPPC